MNTLKFEKKNLLFKQLRYEMPKWDEGRFTFYKGIELEKFGQFSESLSDLVSDFFDEVNENTFSEKFSTYKMQTLSEIQEIKKNIEDGKLSIQRMALIMLGCNEEIRSDNTEELLKAISPIKKRPTLFHRLEIMLSFQWNTCKSLLKELEEKYTGVIVHAPEIATEIKKPILKIESKLNKTDLICLFWLLYQSNILKFRDKAHLIGFLQDNFKFFKAQDYHDITNVGVELSRIFPESFEYSEQKLLKEIESIFSQFNDQVINHLKNGDFNSPIQNQ